MRAATDRVLAALVLVAVAPWALALIFGAPVLLLGGALAGGREGLGVLLIYGGATAGITALLAVVLGAHPDRRIAAGLLAGAAVFVASAFVLPAERLELPAAPAWLFIFAPSALACLLAWRILDRDGGRGKWLAPSVLLLAAVVGVFAGRASVSAEYPLDPSVTADRLRPFVQNALRCGRSGDASTCVWPESVLQVEYVPAHAVVEAGAAEAATMPYRCISGSSARILLDRLPYRSRQGSAHGTRRIGDDRLAVLFTGVIHGFRYLPQRALLLWGCGAIDEGVTDGVKVLVAYEALVAELGEGRPIQ